MIKLKDILNEALNIYSVNITIISDKGSSFTDILDSIRATRKVTIVNVNTSDDLEAKNRQRSDGKELRTATMKFVAGDNPQQDLKFLKTTMLSSDKGDPGMRAKGLLHLIFKPETLNKL